MGIELHEYGRPVFKVLNAYDLGKQKYVRDIDREIAKAIRLDAMGYKDARTKYIAMEKERQRQREHARAPRS